LEVDTPLSTGGNGVTQAANVIVRSALASDLDFMWEMLALSAYATPDEVRSDSSLSTYLAQWSSQNDIGFVASSDGDRYGAAWICRFSAKTSPYHYVYRAPAQIVIACHAGNRAQGIGSLLMRELVSAADRQQIGGLSLNVRADNPAVAFYPKFGFEPLLEVTNRVGGKSVIMWRPAPMGDAPG
jgi:GNAT superfamily N-acetyltransferase